MPSSPDDLKEAIAKFKQDAFAKLTLMGMPHGDAATMRHLWKLINICANLCSNDAGRLEAQPGMRQIVKALSKDLGAQRADEFTKWLTDRISRDFTKSEKTHVPSSAESEAPASKEAQVDAIAFLKSEGRSARCPQAGDSCIGDSQSKHTAASKSTKIAVKESRTTAEVVEEESAKTPVLDELYVEVKSKDGKVYYWDRRSNSAIWSLPAGVRARWVRHKSPDGHTYYSDRSDSNRKTVWVLPALASATEASKEQASGERNKTQKSTEERPPSQAHLFLPEFGLLKPVVLPVVPVALDGNDDLGPFETVLRPETPVLTDCEQLLGRENSDSAACPASNVASETVVIPSAPALPADANHDGHAENESMKKDLQIKLLTCKLEIMSADTSSLREELESLKKKLAGNGVEGRAPPMSSEKVASACAVQDMTPLRRKASAAKSTQRQMRVGSMRTCDIDSDAESDASGASDVTQLSELDEDEEFDTYRAPSRMRREASSSGKKIQDAGKRKIEQTVFERTSRRRSSLGGA